VLSCHNSLVPQDLIGLKTASEHIFHPRYAQQIMPLKISTNLIFLDAGCTLGLSSMQKEAGGLPEDKHMDNSQDSHNPLEEIFIQLWSFRQERNRRGLRNWESRFGSLFAPKGAIRQSEIQSLRSHSNIFDYVTLFGTTLFNLISIRIITAL